METISRKMNQEPLSHFLTFDPSYFVLMKPMIFHHRIFSFFLVVSAVLFFMSTVSVSAAQQIPLQQRNQRQFIVLWKDDQVFGQGFHRPYSNIAVEDENGDSVWKGQTDARGSFDFLL